jgi:lipopolysaccharide export system protein LptA
MRHIYNNFLLVVLLMIASLPVSLLSQERTVIHVERAQVQRFDIRAGRDIEKLIGNVILRQDSTWFYCDSAYLNEKTRNFDAFGNVHIKVSDTLNIYSDLLKYNGETRIAELFDNVKMVDDSTVLETNYLIYNRLTRLAKYPDNGVITSGQNILKSKRGYYRTDLKEFYFARDVELINPDYTTYTDTMVYNTTSEISYFYGPTLIRGKENTIYCEYGWYDTGRDHAHLSQKTSMKTNDQLIESDKLFYDRNTGFGDAAGNVIITDTTNKLIIKGEVGKIWEDEGRSYVTDKAKMISYDKNDSLFMHADTLFMFFDKDRKAEKMMAHYGVRFYRKSLQGKCDSLAYHMSDSTMRLYNNPVLWSDENQLTADSMHVVTRNDQLDSLVMYNSAFIVSRDTIKGFNQIKGKNMVGYFKDNELDRIFVDGNAQTVYWVREEDSNLIGINLAKSSTMLIKLEESEIKGITYYSNPSEVMYPEEELPPEESTLRGFQWLDALRPTDKQDIFRRPVVDESTKKEEKLTVPEK